MCPTVFICDLLVVAESPKELVMASAVRDIIAGQFRYYFFGLHAFSLCNLLDLITSCHQTFAFYFAPCTFDCKSFRCFAGSSNSTWQRLKKKPIITSFWHTRCPSHTPLRSVTTNSCKRLLDLPISLSRRHSKRADITRKKHAGCRQSLTNCYSSSKLLSLLEMSNPNMSKYRDLIQQANFIMRSVRQTSLTRKMKLASCRHQQNQRFSTETQLARQI